MFGSDGVDCWVNHFAKHFSGRIGQSDYFGLLQRMKESQKNSGSSQWVNHKERHFWKFSQKGFCLPLCPSAKNSLSLGVNTRRVENTPHAKLY
jgi:hypothetical protein